MTDRIDRKMPVRPSPVHIEHLEPRRLLALVWHEVYVAVYRDLNRNGRRDGGENGLPGWVISAPDRIDEWGNPGAHTGVTDADGINHFNTFGWESTGEKALTVRVAASNRWWSTNRAMTASGYEARLSWSTNPGNATASLVEIALSDRQVVGGKVQNLLSLSDAGGSGQVFANPVSGRRVWDDVDGDGRIDSGEPLATSDLDGSYRLRLKAGTHTLRVEQPSGWRASGAQKFTLRPVFADGSVIQSSTPAPDFSVSMSKPAVIDLLVGYTGAAAEDRSDAEMVALVRQMVADANRPYANSGTNVVLNLVRTVRTGYTESGRIGRDLDRLYLTADGYADDLAKNRNRYKADVVVMLTSDTLTRGDSIGLSYEFTDHPDSAALGCAVVTLQDRGDDWVTLAHEVGHVLGAGHDLANSDGAEPRAFAHGYRFRGTDGRTYKDIMSYGSGITLPFFSNPDLSWAGKVLGDAKSADNARAVAEIARVVARYR
jgi:hypothetical protein